MYYLLKPIVVANSRQPKRSYGKVFTILCQNPAIAHVSKNPQKQFNFINLHHRPHHPDSDQTVEYPSELYHYEHQQ